MKQSTKKTSPGMDTYPVLCTRFALRSRDDHFRHHVQAFGNIQHGYRSLHRLALPAMGNQAFLESICRLDQD